MLDHFGISAEWSSQKADSPLGSAINETDQRRLLPLAASEGLSVHDNNGNTQTKVVGTNTTTYAWDYENRLTSVTLPGSGGTVSFKYDPFGRRIYKSSSSGTSIYAYDLQNLIEETSSSGAVFARYAQGVKIDEHVPEQHSRSAGANLHVRLVRQANLFLWLADESVSVHGAGV